VTGLEASLVTCVHENTGSMDIC
jgi:hypothetical protein